ncbi:hypothetical protein GQ44DRAFT_733064 [Phaeosphaeriaceae sp. PMI808]|nr:hypothetical protein GQ44DRAFT_733064 [Phaeosphaeriaceae sp. PMI808]
MSSQLLPYDMECSSLLYYANTRALQVKSHWNDVGSEFIYNTCAKLQLRLRKFEFSKQSDCLCENWTESIQQHIVSAHAFIEKHWQSLLSSTQAKMNTTAMRGFLPENDLDMSLPVLDEFLAAMNARCHDISSSTFSPSSAFPVFPAAQLPVSVTSPHGYTHFRLVAFEEWVEHHLQSWTTSQLLSHATCGELRRLIEHYFDKARAVYKDIPVSLSVMYLTLAELWIACDQSACALYPQLRGYDPEICLTEFQCLVLPLKTHMERLHEVEGYVQSRRKQAISGLPSLYRSFDDRSSFAVRYFDQSEELQATFTEIERDATEKRKRKRQELKNLKNKYDNLMRQYNGASCDSEEYVYNRRFGYIRSRHPSWCRRCSYKKKADDLSIDIYEWPLSSNVTIAKATVFELKIPQAFSDWRDASMYMISTVLGHRETASRKPSCSYTLNTHQDISHMLSPLYTRRRIVPLSEVKPYNVTHRKQKKTIPHLTDEDICLNNALKYAYYDTELGVLTATALICTEDIPQRCMYHMPHRSQTIERFIYRPPKLSDGLCPNEVIASLSDCPAHMSIEEYKAQVGLPSTDIERVNHLAASEEAFGRAMLEQLDIALRRVSENWESWRATACFSLLARRISSLTRSPEVHTQSLAYLARLRSIEAASGVFDRWRAEVGTVLQGHRDRSAMYHHI